MHQHAQWLVVAALCDCNRVAITVMDRWTPGTEAPDPGERTAVGADWRPLAQRLALDLRQATGRPISAPCSTVIARDTDRRLQLAGELTELLYAIDS